MGLTKRTQSSHGAIQCCSFVKFSEHALLSFFFSKLTAPLGAIKLLAEIYFQLMLLLPADEKVKPEESEAEEKPDSKTGSETDSSSTSNTDEKPSEDIPPASEEDKPTGYASFLAPVTSLCNI